MMLKEGDKAPRFSLTSADGDTVSLSDFEGNYVVVYFYPKDNTPGCTREAIAFSEALPKFAELGARVLGISKDSVKAHCAFRDKHQLKVQLLSDPELVAHRGFGAYGEKVMYGRRTQGTLRSTFIVAPDGTLARVYPKVSVDGHADAVLNDLRMLAGKRAPTNAR